MFSKREALKILKKLKMKFHQMKMTDVDQTTAFDIVEIERFVDAVSLFVVAVALVIYLIDFRFDALIASIAVSIAVTKPFAFDAVMNSMMIESLE